MSLIFSKSQVESNIIDPLLEQLKRQTNDKVEQNIQTMLLYQIQALSQVAKESGAKLEAKVDPILQFISLDAKAKYKLVTDNQMDFNFELIVQVTSLFDYYLSTINNIIQGGQVNLKDSQINQILNLATELINFDPNSAALVNFNENEMELEEDDYYDSDELEQDDPSWRVRKGSLVILQSLAQTQSKEIVSNILQYTMNAQISLLQRIREKNENVKLAVYQAVESIIKGIIVEEVIRDDDEEVGANLVLQRVSSVYQVNTNQILQITLEELAKVIFDKKTKDHVRVSSFILIERISKLANYIILQDKDTWKIYNNIMEKIFSTNYSNEVKVSAIGALSYLYHLHPKYYKQIIQEVKNCANRFLQTCESLISHQNLKIVCKSLDTISCLIKLMHKSFEKDKSMIKDDLKRLFVQILKQLEITDLDTSIKYSLLQLTSNYIKYYLDYIDISQLNSFLKIFDRKLNMEIKKIPVLNAISKIPQGVQKLYNQESKKLLSQLLKSVINLSQKADRSIRINVLMAIENLVKIDVEDLDNTVQNLGNSLSSDDIILTSKCIVIVNQIIAKSHKADYKPFATSLVNTIVKSSSYLQIEELSTCLENLIQAKHINGAEILKKLEAQIDKEQLQIQTLALAKVIIASGISNSKVDGIIKGSFKNNNLQVTNLYLLGHIGKYEDLSANKQVFTSLISQMKTPDIAIDIKRASATALGGVCLNKVESILPIILDFIQSGGDAPFLILNTLKEIVVNVKKIDQNVKNLISFLMQLANNDNKDIASALAECFGKLTKLDPEIMCPHISNCLKSNNTQQKVIAASSFRYFISKNIDNNNINQLISQLLPLVNDKEKSVIVNSIKSLHAVIYSMPSYADKILNPALILSVAKSMVVDKTKITEIDFGAFTQKHDENEEWRLAAFQLIDIIYQNHYSTAEQSISEIFKNCIENIDLDIVIEVNVLRLKIANKILEKKQGAVSPYLAYIVEKASKILPNFAKKDVHESRSVEVFVLNFMKLLKTSQGQAEIDNNDNFKNFYNKKIYPTVKFKEIIDSLE